MIDARTGSKCMSLERSLEIRVVSIVLELSNPDRWRQLVASRLGVADA